MKKQVLFALATMVLASCSSDGLVNNSSSGGGEAPIAFSVEKKNITRATKDLEKTGHYNFGVWAYKGNGTNSQLVMDNYLVGYSDETTKKGYEHSGCSTWAATIGTQGDHKSPWFYENLGKKEYTYTGTDGYYKNDDTDAAFMSANDNQYLRYWDLAYTNTYFYAYAPYRKTGVSFDGKKTITVTQSAQTAGYDDPSLQEFMYAGASATNSDLKDVKLTFKHLGAQVNLRFYESVRGYKVEIIDVIGNDANGDPTGIQATPAIVTESGTPATKSYTKRPYFISCGATIDYTTVTNPTATVNFPTDAQTTDAQTTEDNLKFTIPGKDNGLEKYDSKRSVTYYVIPDSTKLEDQKYAESPTVYYPVAQPTESEVGFTFHVSYKLIAEDNGEEITVHDARVYVPAYVMNGTNKDYIAAWQPNTKYTYTFKITKNSTGTTNPNDSEIDPTSPKVPADLTVYPIVFDGATIEDYTPNSNAKEY